MSTSLKLAISAEPSLIDRLIDALLGDTLFPAVRMLQGNKVARDLIAAARDNILEWTAGDPAMEIENRYKGGSEPASWAFDRHEN